MFSIVIPLYDKAAQVRDTLESVRIQVFSDYEVIVVDDASKDGGMDVIRDYLSLYEDFALNVRLFSQPHAGVSAARNRGIQESRYDWIAFLDADDKWMPDYLQAQYALSLKYPFCAVLGARYLLRYNDRALSPAKLSGLPFEGTDGVLDNYFEVAVRSHPPLHTVATIVRKDAILATGGFPEGVASGEDLLAWARLAIKYPIAYNTKPLGIHDRDHSRWNSDQRERMPAPVDTVGRCLEDLYSQHATVTGLRAYVGLWYKMRARIYLSHSMRRAAWAEWRKLIRFTPTHYKTWAYLVLLISPRKVID
jgi:glycosyltransferase involved in cell wall biosynthesis